jgi:tRNA pseudouridine55 synthase
LIPEDAVLLCDKPAGVTSHDVVAEVKRELRRAGTGGSRRRGPRVGHAGTLDPFATGLLIVLTGRSTRLQRYLMALPKTYRATARLGWRSSTGDPDGELVETGRLPEKLELPEGRIRQRVPMTSAVKVEGERLYRKAHRGEQIETPEREVTIYEARLLAEREGEADFEITCSAGTYIRTLIETLEDAYCSELRRIASGPHRVADGQRRVLTPAEALSFLPSRHLDEDEARRVGVGQRIAAAGDEDEGPIALLRGERLIAIAHQEEDELLPEVVLV